MLNLIINIMSPYQTGFFYDREMSQPHGAKQGEDLGERGLYGDRKGTWVHEEGQILRYKENKPINLMGSKQKHKSIIKYNNFTSTGHFALRTINIFFSVSEMSLSTLKILG